MTEDYKMHFVDIRVPDLMNLVDVLNLALGKQQAEDIAKCHNNLVDTRYSPLTKELESVRDRFDGYVKDYWAEKGRAQAEAELSGGEEVEESEESDLPTVEPLGSLSGDRKAPPMEFEMDEVE